jgi:5-methylcytosine-specific restriction enzyme subunit McrC
MEETTSFPRGRILIGQTVKSLASKGVTHKVAATWFQRTADIPVNRCLKYAVWLLAQMRSTLTSGTQQNGSRALAAALSRAYRSFDGIDLDLTLGFVADPFVCGIHPLPSLRSYYRNALDLAVSIIQQRAVTLQQTGDDLVMPSFVINMADVFEAYIRNLLAANASAEKWDMQVLDGNLNQPLGGQKPLFTTGSQHRNASPDVVVALAPELESVLLIEVKYRQAEKVDRGDLNQAIAYGVSYGSKDVVLVQPRGIKSRPVPGLRQLGTIGSMTVHQYVFDLNARDLHAEEEAFASRMKTLCDSRLQSGRVAVRAEAASYLEGHSPRVPYSGG